jgi:hypothetical protein
MHVTAIKAALAEAVVSAFGSTVTGLVIQRSTKSKDHLARLWERKAEAYEAVLASVAIKDFRRWPGPARRGRGRGSMPLSLV